MRMSAYAPHGEVIRAVHTMPWWGRCASWLVWRMPMLGWTLVVACSMWTHLIAGLAVLALAVGTLLVRKFSPSPYHYVVADLRQESAPVDAEEG